MSSEMTTPPGDMRVVDAATGEDIAHVVAVDAASDRIRRLEVDGDSLVVERGDFVMVEEDRPFRILSRSDVPAVAPQDDASAESEGNA